MALHKVVKLYGGCVDGGRFKERNWVKNATVIDGGGTSRQQVLVTCTDGDAASADTRIDGFTIPAGKRSSGGMNVSGGSPPVVNCTFSGNSTGNMSSGDGFFHKLVLIFYLKDGVLF